jgi:hypothetical protein
LTWPDGGEIAGYGFDDCRVSIDFDQVYTPVEWAGKSHLSELRDKEVVLHIELPGAVLYSFRFTGSAV